MMLVTAFDTVRIETDGGVDDLSPEQFFALPLSKRIRHVIEQTPTFLRDGRPVDRKEALNQLRQAQAKSA